MRIPLATLSALLGLSACLVPAAAEDVFPSRGFTLGPRFSAFQPDQGGNWTGFGGLQARLHFTPIWAIEGAADYRRRLLPGGRVDVYPVQASLMAYLFPNPARVTPFVLAGGGWHFTHVDTPTGDTTSNRFGAHAGGGLQVFLGNKWSIDASYRHFWLEEIGGGNLLNQSFADDGHHVTAALNFHF